MPIDWRAKLQHPNRSLSTRNQAGGAIMPKSTKPALERAPGFDSGVTDIVNGNGLAPTGQGDVYTMAEAARLKGVSYHTVSRAVRRGKLPVRRLGRMALITVDDLRDWRPMRERAPRKYRRREPNPDATPALLDLASGARVDLARRLSTLYEILHESASELPLPDFLDLLSDRLASALDFRRIAVWGLNEDAGTVIRLATFGPPLSQTPDETTLENAPYFRHAMDQSAAFVIEDVQAAGLPVPDSTPPVTSLFGVPLRVGDRLLGIVFGDCAGESFTLSTAQLELAQVLANQASLALEQAALRDTAAQRVNLVAAAVEDLGDAIRVCDAHGHLVLSNAADRALIGSGADSVAPGMSIEELSDLEQRHDLDGNALSFQQTPLARALGGERIDGQRLRGTGGGQGEISVDARPLMDGETLLGAVAITRAASA